MTLIPKKPRVTLALFRDREYNLAGLTDFGVSINAYPLIAFTPVKDFETGLQKRWAGLLAGEPGYLLFTSGRAVERFAEIIAQSGYPVRQGVQETKIFSRVISVGPATTARLNELGIYPDYVPEQPFEGQAGVWQIIHSHRLSPIIHVRPVRISEFLEEKLKEYGYDYEGFPVYQTVFQNLSEAGKDEVLTRDYLFFSSSSIVESFVHNFREKLSRGADLPSVILIGENTRKTYEDFFSLRKKDTLLLGQAGDGLEKRLLQTLDSE